MLAVRNFTSAATGLAVAIALFRGLMRRSAPTLGNYWVDLTRADALHPPAAVVAGRRRARLAGGAQTWDSARRQRARCKAGRRPSRRVRSPRRRPSRSWAQRRRLLNANSAHPFENPTPLSNWLQMFALLLAPFALTFTFGRRRVTSGRAGPSSGPWPPSCAVRRSRGHARGAGGQPAHPGAVEQIGLATWRARRSRFGAGAAGPLRNAYDGHQHGRRERHAR